jgi:hypothetical protein
VVLWGILGVLANGPIAAQADPTPAGPPPVPIVVRSGAFAVTPPLASLAPAPPAPGGLDGDLAGGEIPRGPVRRDFGTPLQNFDGLSNDDNFAAFGGRLPTPDSTVAVGPDHLVQTVSSLVRVYGKTGTPLTSPAKLSSLFSALGPGSACALDAGDSIVAWDPLASRFVVTNVRLPDFPNAPSVLCVAVSQTGDPTGPYFAYDFQIDGKLLDSGKLGVWPDAYYVGANQFTPVTLTPAGAAALALDRTKMVAGDPTATGLLFDLATFAPDADAMLPVSLDGVLPPPPYTPGLFAEVNGDEAGGGQQDSLSLFELRPNFANPAGATFARRPNLLVDAFDPRSPAGRADIEQPGAAPNQYLDSVSGRLMHRLAYRNLGTGGAPVNSYVLNFTVNVSGVDPATAATFEAGIRWMELRRNPMTGVVTTLNQGTHAASGRDLWMASVAQDHQGNTALGYSSASPAALNPSILYTGRLSTDPPDQLSQGEHDLIVGSGIQTSTANRWGDYSSMAVDPADGCTFWYTNQYYAATSDDAWRTRIGAFRFPGCTPAPTSTLQGQVTDGSGAPVSDALVRTSSGYIRKTDPLGQYFMQVADNILHRLAVSKGTCRAVAPDAVVPAGATVTRDVVLDCTPLFGDVPDSSIFSPSVFNLYVSGVTGGCATQPVLLYCPSSPVTREQMAAFVIRALGQFDPPAPTTQRFADVSPSSPFYPFIDEMAGRGVTFGCAPNLYCPGDPVTREQMAAFVIRALGQFSPPAPTTQRFADVPPSSPFYPFIDEMARRNVTAGCAPNLYCPGDPVTREQMAVFIIRAFNL